jgi:hypothetical protein
MEKPKLNKDKLRALIHYVVHRIDRPADLGAVKLHKILWFSEMMVMYREGRLLCGETFLRMPRGPWGSHVDKVLANLEKNKLIAERPGTKGPYQQRQFFSTAEPSLELFSASEISVVDQMIDHICYNHSASSISEVTHDKVWHSTPMNGVMPIDCIFDGLVQPASEEDLEWAKKSLSKKALAEIKELGLA